LLRVKVVRRRCLALAGPEVEPPDLVERNACAPLQTRIEALTHDVRERGNRLTVAEIADRFDRPRLQTRRRTHDPFAQRQP